MIPPEYKQDIIQSGMGFMRSITEAYGSDEGMKLWDTIASVLDPDIKGQIFFAMLTGEYNNIISLTSCQPGSNKVSLVKSIRTVTGMGLKEAKDICDNVLLGKPERLTINPKHRIMHLKELRNAGFNV